MKTLSLRLLCAKFIYFLLPSFSRLSWLKMQGKNLFRSLLLKQKCIAHAFRELAAGLDAVKLSLIKNNQFLIGISLMLVVAPLMSVAYQLFDPKADIVGWYYGNYYYLGFILCPHIYNLTTLLGIFLLFPPRSTRAWVLALPAGYTVAKIIWLCNATSNETFHQVIPYSVIILGALFSMVLFGICRWAIHRKFHRHDAIVARIHGIIDAPGLDPAMRTQLLHREHQALKKYEATF